MKENTKAPRHWPLWGEFTGDRCIPRIKGQLRGKVSIWWRHHALHPYDYAHGSCFRFCFVLFFWLRLVFTRKLVNSRITSFALTSYVIAIEAALKNKYDDVIKWKHFSRYLTFVQGIHRSLVNSPHKSQWRGAVTFSLICAWTRWFETPSRSLWRPVMVKKLNKSHESTNN